MDRVPTFDELLWPTIKALKALGGSGSNEELLNKVIELEHIPEHIQSQIHTDNRSTKVAYNLAWAKTYLKKVGALENSSRGVWSLTEAGEQLTPEQCRDVPAIVRRDEAVRRIGQVDRLPVKDVAGADAARDVEQEDGKDRLLAVKLAM
jgi:restriction system protein